MEKIKRIFTCKNRHTYESKEPITTLWAERNISPKLKIPIKANDMCKFCGALIISEDDYVKDKLVMGAKRIFQSKRKREKKTWKKQLKNK